MVYRTNKVLIEGINMKLKRMSWSAQDEAQGIIHKMIKPVHVSNVSLIDRETEKSTRIRFGYLGDGN